MVKIFIVSINVTFRWKMIYRLFLDYYGDTFFQSAGTQLSPYVIQVILGAVSVVGTIPALVSCRLSALSHCINRSLVGY